MRRAVNLIYLVAVGENDSRFYDSVQWCVRSLRQFGKFTGDIIVITDNISTELQQGINNKARLLEVDAELLYDPEHGRSDSEKYLMARLRVHQFIDLSVYDTVMYVDADVLAISDINTLFENVNEFRFSREFQPMSAPMYNGALTDSELTAAKWQRGVNSGIYLAPANYLKDCLDVWKQVLDSSPNADAYDQPALNSVVLRKLIRARPLPAFSVGYPNYDDFSDHIRPQTMLLHYCGNRLKKFARMQRHFDSLQKDTPLQIHFGIDEDMELTSNTTCSDDPWVSGGDKKGLIIAMDYDRDKVESYSLVNQNYARELRRLGHQIIELKQIQKTRPDIVIHHNFERDFCASEIHNGIPHIAVRTSDFGPYPKDWVQYINTYYEQLWVHTEWIRQHALEGGVDPHRIRLVPHGINPTVFRPIGDHYSIQTEKKFRFLFVGGTVVRKGIDTLLNAYVSEFGPDEDVSLVIKSDSTNVFYKNSPFDESIKQMSMEPDLPEIIHIDAHLPSLELAALYRACSVGVWPYRAEGFLIPALESMACGTPTMLPEFGPTSDFSDSRTSFLVPAIHVKLPCQKQFSMRLGFKVALDTISLCEIRTKTLAEELRTAFEADKTTMNAKAGAGVAMAHGRFTWSKVANTIETCLKNLIITST